IWVRCLNIFLYDHETGRTTWVSKPSRAPRIAAGVNVTPASIAPSISGDGARVVFMSRAENLVDGDSNGVADIFVYERETGNNRLISISSDGEPANNLSYRPIISQNGRY